MVLGSAVVGKINSACRGEVVVRPSAIVTKFFCQTISGIGGAKVRKYSVKT